MARYEYLCKDCGAPFEVQRSMADAEGDDVRCPAGHTAVRRRFSVFASLGSGGSDAPAASTGVGGGCCGGGCGCR
jgi:putative FmdB family regulatory protein